MIAYVDREIHARSLPDSFYIFFGHVSEHIDRMKVHFDGDRLVVFGLLESLLIVTSVLFLVGLLKISGVMIKARFKK